MNDINGLISVIGETQQYFKLQASKQVDVALTLRNWLFGYYIAEYELNGADRANYGARLFKEIAKRLEKKDINRYAKDIFICAKISTLFTQTF